MGLLATSSPKMKGLKVFLLVLVFGFSAVQAQTLDAQVTVEASEECKFRRDYTKWFAKDKTAPKTDFAGSKQDKPILFEPVKKSWFALRDTDSTKALATWKFEIPKENDAFICFAEFHVPRAVATTPDETECVSANEDVLLVKDGTDTLLTCCGTQCHAKTFKIAKDAADKTYTVTLEVRGKDKYPSRWLDPSGTLEKYKLLYKDVVRLQVSASAKTKAEEDKKKADDDAAAAAAKKSDDKFDWLPHYLALFSKDLDLEGLAKANLLTGDNIKACKTGPDGTSLVKATEASIAFDVAQTDKKCVLIVYKADTTKKATLTLPASFGGAGEAGKGINVFVGLSSDGTKMEGESLFKNELTTALTKEEMVEWFAPIVTIHFDQGATAFTKLDGAKLDIAT